MKLIIGMFHANAVVLLLVAFIAYHTPGSMLIAAMLFSLAIVTEAAVIFYTDDADPVTPTEQFARRIQRKVARIKAKKRKEKREQYLCSKCQQTTPVMS